MKYPLACLGTLIALSLTGPAQAARSFDNCSGYINALPVVITTQVLDVSDRQAMEHWAARCVAEHGQVNLVFNNAGVALSSTVEGVDYADLEWIVGINFWGVVHGTKAFLPHLKACGEGHVINTSSVFGLFAQPGMSGYNATKFAVRGFTESLRQELDMQRCGVSATCVHPGGIRTDICRSSRIDANMTGFLIHSEQQARADFEKLFITDADQAAKAILHGVRKNKRRVLIGRDAYFLDLLARCLQHEIDHLHGKLYIDYLSVLKRRSALAKWASMSKDFPQNIRKLPPDEIAGRHGEAL